MFVALLKIFAGFAVCCIFSALGLYAALEAAFKDANFISGNGRPRTGFEIFAIVVGLAAPFVLFAATAYFLRGDLRSFEPQWMPNFTLCAIFALMPILLPASILFGRNVLYAIAPVTPEYQADGELIRRCPDGSIEYRGFRQNGIHVGEEIRRDCGGASKTIQFYGDDGRIVWRKQFAGEVLSEEEFVEGGERIVRVYGEDNRIESEFRSQFKIEEGGFEIITRTIKRTYNSENGTHVDEEL